MVTDLSYLGWLKISGEDSKKFLQGQLTCNMEEVTPAQSQLGAHCNPKGRIISLFRIFLFKESYYLQMPREMISVAMNALKKYAVFFKVQLVDVSDESNTLFDKITSENPLSFDQWQCQNIEAKLAQIYPETSELFLPHELELHLNNGISFNKGCYTGQEIIARMHYRGQLKTQLTYITIKSDVIPKRGEDLSGTQDRIVDFYKKGDDLYGVLILKKI
jgi:folate-binding protein YgfZ